MLHYSAMHVQKYVMPVRKSAKSMLNMEWNIVRNVLKHADDVLKNVGLWQALMPSLLKSPCINNKGFSLSCWFYGTYILNRTKIKSY